MKLELTNEELDIIEEWYRCSRNEDATGPRDVELHAKLCRSQRDEIIEQQRVANQPKIILTASALLDKGVWIKFCEMRGINDWAISEGQMDSSEEFRLTLDEANKLGLLKGLCDA